MSVIRGRDVVMRKSRATYRIESSNGVTEGPYPSRRSAQAAADSANAIAPEQGWHPVPESEYPR